MAMKEPASITPDQSVSEAFQTILRHEFNHLLEWEQVARSSENISGVHKTRVAFRRYLYFALPFLAGLVKIGQRKFAIWPANSAGHGI